MSQKDDAWDAILRMDQQILVAHTLYEVGDEFARARHSGQRAYDLFFAGRYKRARKQAKKALELVDACLEGKSE